MTIYNRVRAAIHKRAEYQRIKFEVSNMSLTNAHDIGFFPEDAAKIANRAVYG